MSTGREALRAAADLLESVADDPRREARALLAHALELESPARLHLDPRAARPESPLDTKTQARFDALVERRASGVPLQYVLGLAHFWEGRFRVRPGVLIPRPETERVVEIAIDAWGDPASPGRLLDLGTGAGVIAISLLGELPSARADAVDSSADAIELARDNARACGVAARLSLHLGDLFAPLAAYTRGGGGQGAGPEAKPYRLVVSNPPYVATRDALPPEVREHEPPDALFAGTDGLDVIRRIVGEAPAWLETGGHLVVEIGASQGAAARDLFDRSGAYTGVRIVRDLGGRDRVAVGRVSARPR